MLLKACLFFWCVAASRALECAKCANVTSPQNCQQLETCNSGDRCYTSSHGVGTDSTFDLGCKTESECIGAASASLVGRSVTQQQCNQCCTEDHCNQNLCSVGSHGRHRVAFNVTVPNGNVIDRRRPIFTNIITNVGGGYDPSTAKFTCPVSGLYQITFDIQSNNNSTIGCWMFNNGDSLIYAQSSGYIKATESAYLELIVGDIIKLECTIGWDHVLQSNGVSFSGALLEG